MRDSHDRKYSSSKRINNFVCRRGVNNNAHKIVARTIVEHAILKTRVVYANYSAPRRERGLEERLIFLNYAKRDCTFSLFSFSVAIRKRGRNARDACAKTVCYI